MKKVWIIVVLGIVAAGVIIAVVKILPSLKPRAEIRILDIEGKPKLGETLTINTEVKNTGKMKKNFTTFLYIHCDSETTSLSPALLSLSPGQTEKLSFIYNVPKEGKVGDYLFTVQIYNQDAKGNLKNLLGETGVYQVQVTIFDRRKPAGELILPYAKDQQDFNVIPLKKEVSIEFARSIPSQKIGKDVPIECLVKNAGEYGLSLSVMLEVKPPSASASNFKEELFLASGAQKKITFNYHIPNEIGNYRINAFLYEKDKKGNIVEKIGEVQQSFEVASLITNASIAILNKIGEKKVGEKIPVNLQVKNTGETKRTFITSLTLKGREERNFPTREVPLSPGESSNLDFEYEVLPRDAAGAWRIIAGVWSEKKSDGTLGGKLDETLQEFKILDTPPQITFLSIGASANIGERISLKVKATDDRGIAGGVRITYQFPGMDKKMSSEMTRISGDNRDGVWVFNTDAFTRPGKSIFFVETEDGAGQKVRTEELNIAVVIKM